MRVFVAIASFAFLLAATLGWTAVTIGGLEWAGVQAERHLADQPEAAKYEYSGIIVRRPNGTYAWSAYPHSDWSVDSVRLDPQDMLLPGDTLAGVYHSHPCMPESHYSGLLSKPDVLMAYVYGVPMFMVDMCTGDVHAYDPFKDRIKDTAVTVSGYDSECHKVSMVLPTGRIVGNIGRSFPDQDKLRGFVPAANPCK